MFEMLCSLQSIIVFLKDERVWVLKLFRHSSKGLLAQDQVDLGESVFRLYLKKSLIVNAHHTSFQ